MERDKNLIELSDHVKKKLHQHRSERRRASIDSFDDFVRTVSTDNDRDSASNDGDRKIYKIIRIQRPIVKKSSSNDRETASKQRPCEDCFRRIHRLRLAEERLQTLLDENRQLCEQMRSLLSTHRYLEQENHRLKSHLNQVNSNLYQHQRNFQALKEQISAEKKTPSTKIVDEHLKRLRYEVEMYNRLVATKEREELDEFL